MQVEVKIGCDRQILSPVHGTPRLAPSGPKVLGRGPGPQSEKASAAKAGCYGKCKKVSRHLQSQSCIKALEVRMGG